MAATPPTIAWKLYDATKWSHTEEIMQINQASPLLRLPAEIRNPIYEYAFTGRTVLVREAAGLHRPRRREQRSAIATCQVCRQVRYETRSAFFKYTSFEFSAGIPRAINIARLDIELYNGLRTIAFDFQTTHTIYEMSKLSKRQQEPFLMNHSCGHLPALEHVRVRLLKWDGDLLDFVRRIFGNQELRISQYQGW